MAPSRCFICCCRWLWQIFLLSSLKWPSPKFLPLDYGLTHLSGRRSACLRWTALDLNEITRDTRSLNQALPLSLPPWIGFIPLSFCPSTLSIPLVWFTISPPELIFPDYHFVQTSCECTCQENVAISGCMNGKAVSAIKMKRVFCSLLSGSFLIKFSSLSAPTKTEELTAGSDEKTQRSPTRDRTQGFCEF